MFALVLMIPALLALVLALVLALDTRTDRLCDAYAARFDRAVLALVRKGPRAYVATMRRDPITGKFRRAARAPFNVRDAFAAAFESVDVRRIMNRYGFGVASQVARRMVAAAQSAHM